MGARELIPIPGTSLYIYGHAYKVNHLLKQDENQYVARLNIRGVPFGG